MVMPRWKSLKKKFEAYLNTWLLKQDSEAPTAINKLYESMAYSLNTGGKRFRPELAMLTAQTLNQEVEKVLPVAVAVEMIHTYSLIHDDLPMMDNDDERRGKPTNHKVFGEDVALLTGDALLTEAFYVLATAYEDRPQVAQKTVAFVAKAAGARGMVAGQAIDIQDSPAEKNKWIATIHQKKTGALIAVSVGAAAIACDATVLQQEALTQFAEQLGFAFQLSDDLLDWDPNHPEATSYVSVHGIEETQKLLTATSNECLKALESANLPTEFFTPLVDFNQSRKK